MTKKVKLALGSLGFMAANGASVPALTYSSDFLSELDLSNTFWEGGAFQSRQPTTKKLKIKKILLSY